ncbi:CU044_5270 family protein [Actinomadura violacea]|nr:CU044_5270 family protein [Actinomadura violacea]
MNPVDSNSGKSYSRYLSRVRRTIWLPVDGDATHGVLETDVLPPKPYPGYAIPPEARKEAGHSGPAKAADFDHRAEWLRTDYAYLSRLPADPAGMYEHLYSHLGAGPEADGQAWQNVGSMLTEAYMPAAQRKALFRAAAAIAGVRTVGKAVDAAGRTGVAVSLDVPGSGQRDEYIFAPKTYSYLGQRTVVTDASIARAPAGTVVTSTAQLSVRLVDRAPTVAPG